MNNDPAIDAYLHNLLLLSDSALPLGSFAFSSGLESFLAHQPRNGRNSGAFLRFLDLSVTSLAGSTLPYVVEAHCTLDLVRLDNDLDASTTCVVAKRASVQQGRALVTVWDRSLKANGYQALELEGFAQLLKSGTVHGHLAPLFGVTCRALSIPLAQTLYIYLFNHVKTLVSAGIRASVLGPYQGQRVLGSISLQTTIKTLISDELAVPRSTADAGQSVPVLDLWGGRHEIIYSRIFNS